MTPRQRKKQARLREARAAAKRHQESLVGKIVVDKQGWGDPGICERVTKKTGLAYVKRLISTQNFNSEYYFDYGWSRNGVVVGRAHNLRLATEAEVALLIAKRMAA